MSPALPSITVITPCYNAAAELPGCLDSVRAQEYPRLEHVVVDGGSTDGTVDLLRKRDDLHWISEPDENRPDAANKGASRSSGEIVGWLNADDRYEPGTLEVVGRTFAADPELAWVTGYCRIVGADEREIRRPVTAYKNFLLRHYSFPLYLTQNFISDPATFLRRSALDRVGPMDTGLTISHDYDLWLRVAAHGDPVVLRRYLARYRAAGGTLSAEGFETQFREHEEVARRHGAGHRLAVAGNAVMSRIFVAAYRAMRLRRRLVGSA